VRGGASRPAAQLLFCLLSVTVLPLRAQAPVRTRDVGFATVAYDNGLTLGALTLNESILVERASGELFANGLVSIFNDGRWSMQGLVGGSRLSAPIRAAGLLNPWFRTIRGELGLSTTSTAQENFMPTLQFLGHAKFHAQGEGYAGRVGGALARTFDGFSWRTTVIGDLGGWMRLGSTVVAYTATPMQLQYGDVLGDNEASVSWARGRVTYDATFGVRLGEAQRGTVAWGSFTVTRPLAAGILATASLGSYPVDLIQGLPAGRYAAIAMRLPGGKFPPLRRRQPVRVLPPPPERPELPTTERLSLVIGGALDSLHLREIRVWAPGIERVELLADFTEWIPVPLIRQPNGEWRGFYEVGPGAHRLNLRLDRQEIDVPVNLLRVKDDFAGNVGLIMVR
jgi:hypothetical protein